MADKRNLGYVVEICQRGKLISWQWSDYFSKHRSRTNLIIHIFAIPLFWIGSFGFVLGLVQLQYVLILKSLVLLFLSFGLQGIGHKLEKEPSTPFLGPADFVTRFLTEQFVTFPRFV